jgi:hypothetical protein
MNLGVNQLIGFSAGTSGSKTVLQAITDLGLTTNLQLCLDAGDANSYTSGNSWLDVSGNGYNFFLGSEGDSASTGDEPLFVGSAGDRTSYFEFVNGDEFFRQNPASANFRPISDSWHKADALFQLMFGQYIIDRTSTPGGTMFGTAGSGAPRIGIRLEHEVNETNVLTIRAGTQGTGNFNSGSAMPTGAWTIWFLGVDEATGSGASSFKVNDAADYTFDATCGGTPGNIACSSATSTYPFEIGGAGGAELFDMPGTRWSFCAAWSGTILTSANRTALNTELQKRFA